MTHLDNEKSKVSVPSDPCPAHQNDETKQKGLADGSVSVGTTLGSA